MVCKPPDLWGSVPRSGAGYFSLARKVTKSAPKPLRFWNPAYIAAGLVWIVPIYRYFYMRTAAWIPSRRSFYIFVALHIRPPVDTPMRCFRLPLLWVVEQTQAQLQTMHSVSKGRNAGPNSLRQSRQRQFDRASAGKIQHNIPNPARRKSGNHGFLAAFWCLFRRRGRNFARRRKHPWRYSVRKRSPDPATFAPPHSTTVKPRRSKAGNSCASIGTGASSGRHAMNTRSSASGAGSTVSRA